jgi:hypothetical protein
VAPHNTASFSFYPSFLSLISILCFTPYIKYYLYLSLASVV